MGGPVRGRDFVEHRGDAELPAALSGPVARGQRVRAPSPQPRSPAPGCGTAPGSPPGRGCCCRVTEGEPRPVFDVSAPGGFGAGVAGCALSPRWRCALG